MDIRLLNIIPSYSCNLECPHCFFSHLRTGEKITPSKLMSILKKLLNEGLSDDIFFEWYGGEISMLGYDYFSCLLKISKKMFPSSKHSVVSNLVSMTPSFLSLFRDNFTHATTSFEDLRFNRNSLLFSVWRKNVELLSRYLNINLIIIANPQITEETLKILAGMPFSRISVYPIKIPEEAPEKVKSIISRYAMSIEKTRKIKKLTEEIFGKEKMSSIIPSDFKIWNVLHIFPDGSCGLPSPSGKGFPFEKKTIFSGESILFSPERIKYITEQKIACADCSNVDCNAEFKYAGLCVRL